MTKDRITRAALVAFATSRALLFALILLGSQLALLGRVYGGSVWETSIELMRARVLPELVRTTLIADGYWYRSIALHGYARPGAGDPNWAFFPLYPFLVRAIGPARDFPLDALIVSTIAFGIALWLLGKVAMQSSLTSEDAERAIFYVAFFPTSYFFSLPMTESLFLLLSLWCVFCAQRQQWWRAGAIGGLAALTRFAGVLLLPTLLVMLLEAKARRARDYVALLLVPAGTAAFMLMLYSRTGDPLAFLHLQAQWGRTARWFLSPLVDYVAHASSAAQPWNPLLFNFVVAVSFLGIAATLLVRRQWAFGTYALLSLVVPLTSGSLQSIDRYALVVFPAFLWLAVQGRRPNVDRAILGGFAMLYGCMTVLFIAHIDLALA